MGGSFHCVAVTPGIGIGIGIGFAIGNSRGDFDPDADPGAEAPVSVLELQRVGWRA